MRAALGCGMGREQLDYRALMETETVGPGGGLGKMSVDS